MKVLLCAISVFVLLITLFIFQFAWKKDYKTVSPLPAFLDKIQNNEVTSLSLFLPKIRTLLAPRLIKPEVSAKAALIYDLTSNTFLYEKNIKERLPVASLAKIATAIVGLENQKQDNKYIVNSTSATIGENSMGLSVGEVLTLDELLYGLILVSGNDAAETIAANIPGGRETFIRKMNDKARSLGLTDTVFTNPSGLEEQNKQYSSAYDLLVMTRFALENFPIFAKVAQTFTLDIPYTKTHKEYFLENQTNLLTTYPGVKGVKTGYTPNSGLCLVTYLENGGHKLIGVVLNSPSRREEMRELLDYSFKSVGVKVAGRT